MRIFIGLLAAGLIMSSVAQAAPILRHEPPAGKLPAGESVLVDNGKCPHGEILKITAGANRSVSTGTTRTGSKRIYKCVPR